MPRLSFVYPEMLWLLGLIGLMVAIAVLTPRRLAPWRFWSSLTVRTLIALALVLAIAGVQLVLPVNRLTTVFLLDGSDSLSASARAQAETFIQEALQAMPEDDRAAIVVFGGNALVERAPSEEQRLGRISSVPIATRTNLEQAIQLGLALFPADASRRIVLLSDGGENAGRAVEAARLTASRGVPIEVVALTIGAGEAEALVASVEAPAQVREGQVATVVATIESNVAQPATVRLIGDGGTISEQQLALQPGLTEVTFAVEIAGNGFQRFRVQIEPERDGRAQNNEAAALIQVQGPPRILVVAQDQADAQPLVSALEATNMDPEVLSPAMMPSDLAGMITYDAVILVNTPARTLPVGAMRALPGYVRDLGRGLMMIGGGDSFGVGGYGRTPIEETMPVYMDVRNREERPDLAMVFVIDKSGSMDACHCSSPDMSSNPSQLGGVRKVDIAKEAVAQAAALLGPQDTLGIVTFDSRAFDTLPATTGATLDQILDALSGVEPRGATNLRSGLIQAEAMLQQVDARLKHVVLLTDGWGNGGDQLEIAARMREQGMTLTTIAAGSGSATFLENLATTGGGRYYFAEDITSVPQIFVQETISAVGNYIVERPFTPVIIGSSPVLNGLGGLPPLYGFNGSTLKDSARVLLETDDAQPLLATWQYGLGRSAAWLSDTKGKWAIDWMSWEGFPRFAGQVVGDILPVRGGQEISTDLLVAGGETMIRLNAGPGQENLDVTATLIGTDGSRRAVPLPQVGPLTYQGRVESPTPGTYLVQISGSAADRIVLQEMAGLVVPYSSEYRGGQGNPALLDELAALTGGQRLSEPADAFLPVAGRITQAREIGLSLLLLVLMLLPFDIALRRLMLQPGDLPFGQFWRSQQQRADARRVAAEQVPPDPTMARLQSAKERASTRIRGVSQTPEDQVPDKQAPDDDPLERLRAAKERARKRTSGEEG
ncbi:VWA domain-containing protein [Candidatus Chloroploca sp. Khr17]|uniref:VWA domain-containing protein n=1 Tax=Candidatus Chloroploca sp. Khr17 TaxID=2496869 RepID=UPI00101B97EE|nr:VWA domain-containing protein [Candidatus Chloroploca sp. Khr17]